MYRQDVNRVRVALDCERADARKRPGQLWWAPMLHPNFLQRTHAPFPLLFILKCLRPPQVTFEDTKLLLSSLDGHVAAAEHVLLKRKHLKSTHLLPGTSLQKMSNGPSSSGSSRPPPRGILKRNYPGSPASGATPKPDRSLATDRCQLCPRPFFPHIELRRRVIHHPLTHHFCELPVRCSACNERGAGGGPIRDHIQRAHQGRAKVIDARDRAYWMRLRTCAVECFPEHERRINDEIYRFLSSKALLLYEDTWLKIQPGNGRIESPARTPGYDSSGNSPFSPIIGSPAVRDEPVPVVQKATADAQTEMSWEDIAQLEKSQTSLKLRLDDSETKRKKYQARLTEAVKERNEAKEQLTKATKENARLKAKTEEQEKYIDEQAEKLRQAKGAGIVKEEPGIVAVRPVIIKEEPVEDPRIAKYQAEIATLKQDRSHLNKIVSDQAIQIHKLEKLVPVIQIDD